LREIWKGRENPNRKGASIPPPNSLKTRRRKLPNTGKLHFTPSKKPTPWPEFKSVKHIESAKGRRPANRVGELRRGTELLRCAARKLTRQARSF
jgi:hypothetical protein